MGFKKATRQVLESLNRGLDVAQQRYLALHSEVHKRIDGVYADFQKNDKFLASLKGRIDAQARTIAGLELQIAGLRGSRDAHMAELKSLRTWISDLSKQVAPLIPSPDMVPAGDTVEGL